MLVGSDAMPVGWAGGARAVEEARWGLGGVLTPLAQDTYNVCTSGCGASTVTSKPPRLIFSDKYREAWETAYNGRPGTKGGTWNVRSVNLLAARARTRSCNCLNNIL